MNSMLETLMRQTDQSMDDTHRIREGLQRIALYSLSQSGFFTHAAFVGGTALRLFHDLDRFSEDIDLTLLEPNSEFTFEPFIGRMTEDFNSVGLDLTVTEKDKTNRTKMKSAFIKGNSKEIHLRFGIDDDGIQTTERITIKMELDVDPPSGYRTEWRFGLLPYPHNVLAYDLPTMHACKLHAILCRNWGNRVKGRDYYDLLYYSARGIPVNSQHLIRRLEQSGVRAEDAEDARVMLRERCLSVDYRDAVSDVRPFVLDKRKLDNWSPELFASVVDGLRFVRNRHASNIHHIASSES